MNQAISPPPTTNVSDFLAWALGLALAGLLFLFWKRERDNETRMVELKTDLAKLEGKLEKTEFHNDQLQEQLRNEVKSNANTLGKALGALTHPSSRPGAYREAEDTDHAIEMTPTMRNRIEQLVKNFDPYEKTPPDPPTTRGSQKGRFGK